MWQRKGESPGWSRPGLGTDFRSEVHGEAGRCFEHWVSGCFSAGGNRNWINLGRGWGASHEAEELIEGEKGKMGVVW